MKQVKTNISFPEMERDVLSLWQEGDLAKRSMAEDLPTKVNGEREQREPYVFYDGPPFATGLPHYGHLLAGTLKDVIGRFFTMKGKYVDRRFGWDCHGVPVEFEIQKNLNLHGVKAINDFGVDKFNEECRKIVLRYTKEWEEFVERSGRWVDFDRQYRTMDKDFMESVWWVLKSLWDRGLVYKSVKNVPYSWAISTPLSNFEANLNYKDTQDPAVTVRAKLIGDYQSKFGVDLPEGVDLNLYVWTTTPWTLISNMAIAVSADLTYVLVSNPANNEVAILAKDLLGAHFEQFSEKKGKSKKKGKEEVQEQVEVIGELSGSKLVGLEYQPFFDYFEEHREKNAFRVYAADFVTADEGAGVVHLASFGEEDLGVFLEHNIPIVDPLDEDGNFTDVVTDFAGRNVKAADSEVISNLKKRELLVSHKTIVHSYPFCYRTDTPLIYRSRASWFIEVEKIVDLMQQANSTINWVPEHLKAGRFGKWIEGAQDWAFSRDRFWGTPLPIWECESCEEQVCLGSVAELEEKTGEQVDDLHKHFIDHLSFDCEKCGSKMKRVSQVFDCWFESGSMPYAQLHYPFENKEKFEETFPADFIAEGLDQTRGWFYTLLVLSSALYGRPAFKNVIVNGIVLAEDGKKMSKSLKNYPPVNEIFNEFGADAMRLYLLSSAATRAEELRFSKEGVKQVVRQNLLPLWNAYNFFVTYALVDNWQPSSVETEKVNNLLDRWILSKTASLVKGVDTALNSYHLYLAAQPILDYIDQLTNWYIRLNRRRFWAGNSEAEQKDKAQAYATLHKALVTSIRVLAPLAPFISEEIFQNLKSDLPELDFESVHFAPFPSLDELSGVEIDENLEHAMELFEEVILLGRNIRNDVGIKVRQPLSKLTVVHSDSTYLDKVKLLDDYIKEELNIKEIEYSDSESEYVLLSAKLNLKKLGKELGPKLGSQGMNKLRTFVESLPNDQIKQIELGEDLNFEGVLLRKEDFLIERSTKPGVGACASSGQITILLDTFISRELELEGFAREFINRVQKLRKEYDFEVSDRIVVHYMTACPKLSLATLENKAKIMEETLAVELKEVSDKSELSLDEGFSEPPSVQEIGSRSVIISLHRTQA